MANGTELPELSSPRGFGNLPREGAARTLLVSLAVCLVCSMAVSAAAIWLRPLHRRHLEREKQAQVLELLSHQPGLSDLLDELGSDAIELHLIDLASGLDLPNVDPADFDETAAARDPLRSTAIPKERDLARIERRANWAQVYLVRRDRRIRALILPIHGRGYGGLIRGYLALEGDGNTISGISFYEHSETPGIGTEIDDETWRESWGGKRLRNSAGSLRIRVIEESAADDVEAVHRVDGISGATRSSQGVGNMVRFWMGDDGFGPYLRRFKP